MTKSLGIINSDHIKEMKDSYLDDSLECPWERAKEKRAEQLPEGHEMEELEDENNEDLKKSESTKQQKEDIKNQILSSTSPDAEAESKIPNARAATNLFRSYKHTPHQPLSLGLKYLVHRIEHLDDYKNAGHDKARELDDHFIKFHQRGDAFKKNGHIDSRDLRNFVRINPHLIPQILAHQEKLHNYLQTLHPEKIRDINGEPHVALTRGLNVETPGDDHALSSYADKKNTGFGDYMHHRWVPMKNVFYSYDIGPSSGTSEKFGNEHEFLVSPHKNLKAEPEDIKELKEEGRHSYVLSDNDKMIGKLKDPKNQETVYPHLTNAIENGTDAELMETALKHPKLDENLMHKALDRQKTDGDKKFTLSVLSRRNDLPHTVIDKMLKDYPSQGLYNSLAKNKNLSEQHIHHILDNSKGADADISLSENPNLTPEHIEKIMDRTNTTSNFAKMYAMQHPNASERNLLHGLSHGGIIEHTAVTNPKATPTVLSHALESPTLAVNSSAIQHPNLTHDLVTKATQHKSPMIRRDVLGHPSATIDHAKSLLNDPEPSVRDMAQYHIDRHLKKLNKSEGLYHLCQAKEYLVKNEYFCSLHHAKKALDLGYDCERIFEEARANLRMEKNMAIELLEKGEISNALKALGFAGALATGAFHYDANEPKPPAFNAPIEQQKVIPQVSKKQIIKDKTLRAISKVESNNNPNAQHRQMSSTGLHQGSSAIGSYGLMPITIKEMIKKNPELNKKHGHILGTSGELFKSLVMRNPETEHEIASKLYDNLANKFGHNPERISHAWFNGVTGTIKALQNNKDVGKHWHVKKIMKEYNGLGK